MIKNVPKSQRKMEFGDYQTPWALADACCRVLNTLDIAPASVLEPTCGAGSFLEAALKNFPDVKKAVGIEVNSEYVREAVRRIDPTRCRIPVRVEEGSFFTLDWDSVMAELPDPLLVIGNPPWVTNSALGQIESKNVPEKENLHDLNGLDAITGKSNFDISEYILLRLFERLNGRTATLAMLSKTAVARKVLQHAWKKRLQIGDARIFTIDAQKHFDAAVEACFLVCRFLPQSSGQNCSVGSGLRNRFEYVIGHRDGELVADVQAYERWKHLRGVSSYKWRSGIKHDCSKVMEFEITGGQLKNGLNELVDIEDTFLYPMFKSSSVARGAVLSGSRFMLVPQRQIGDDTSSIERMAPKTWAYLQRHRERLNGRRSVIYADRPPFSVFGVGEYSFASWKVAISGFYKKLSFRVIPSFEGRPSMLDDTVYFLPCKSQQEAEMLAEILNSEAAQNFFRAFIFWDAKRPITASLLSQLSIERLAAELGRSSELRSTTFSGQLVLM
jgi:hypothetical protein